MARGSQGFRDLDHLLWWVFVGTRGGAMRLRIVEELSRGPMNANRLTQVLGVNYRTVRHHLDILVQAGLVVMEGPRYGQLYYLSREMTEALERVKMMAKGGYTWR
ncbi:MAG: ArsR/SmtB family transcription factor [Acidilobus sp.]